MSHLAPSRCSSSSESAHWSSPAPSPAVASPLRRLLRGAGARDYPCRGAINRSTEFEPDGGEHLLRRPRAPEHHCILELFGLSDVSVPNRPKAESTTPAQGERLLLLVGSHLWLPGVLRDGAALNRPGVLTPRRPEAGGACASHWDRGGPNLLESRPTSRQRAAALFEHPELSAPLRRSSSAHGAWSPTGSGADRSVCPRTRRHQPSAGGGRPTAAPDTG